MTVPTLTLPQESIASVDPTHSLLRGTFNEVSIPPADDTWYLTAEYRLWIPEGVEKLKGILVMQHGCERSGLEYVNDLQWQALARKHQMAILGSKLAAEGRPCEFWAFPQGGSELAFLKALHLLSLKTHHLELETLPWVFWGHSGGAEWAAYMTQKYADRTIAAVLLRGGGYLTIGTSNALTIPVLIVSGEDDSYTYDCIEVPQQVFLHQRRQGAYWSFALAPKTGHEAGKTRSLAIPYLDSVLGKRLGHDNQKLTNMNFEQGWLGNLNTRHVISAAPSLKNSESEAWLPSETVALKWQEYIKTGVVLPSDKPTAPTDAHAQAINHNKVLVTWRYIPEMENGLPAFHIYRDKSLVATIEGQTHDFADEPLQVSPVLEFVDQQYHSGATYTISAFNAIGESKSDPVLLTKK